MNRKIPAIMIAIAVAGIVSVAATGMNTPAYAAKGGGGGGAVVENDFPCGVPAPGGGFDLATQSHSVVTPSGNSNLQCHAHPK